MGLPPAEESRLSRLGQIWNRLPTRTRLTVGVAVVVVAGVALAGGGNDPASPTSATAPTTTTTATTVSAPATTVGSAPAATTEPGGATVVEVVDGDTVRVVVDGVEERLRLIGINAPETDECFGSQATAALAGLVAGESVRLEADVSDRDDFGRLLRYVFRGDVFVNERLVEEGYALARRYPPDTARADRLEAAQDRAEAAEAGLWAPDACGAAATGTVEVSRIHPDAAGDDNANLNDEWVEITNAGTGAVDLTGWGIKDESATHRYQFPAGFVLAPDAAVRLHTGCGSDTPTALHWCVQGSAVWNNSGDTVFVLDPAGNVAASRSYGG